MSDSYEEVYGMAHEDHGAVYDLLKSRGVSRRDFLKYCGSLAAMLGLSEAMVPQMVAAVESGTKLQPALWLNGGSCSGCTESIAQVDTPDVASIVLDLLSINYFETIMMAQGDDAEKSAEETINEGGYILIYEGSVMTGEDGNTLVINGRKSTEILAEAAANAAAVLAVGSCAVDGGWVAAAPNPAGAIGVQEFLTDEGITTPVINLPTCPVNPEWIVAMVVDVLLLGKLADGSILDELDDFGRPKLIFGQSIHDNCPRRGHFENGEFVYQFGSEEEAKGYCLYPLGCKGPQTFTNCPIVRWNSRAGWCIEAGSPCIGCGSADPTKAGGNWVDVGTPFLNRHRDLPLGGLGNTAPGTIAGVVGGVAGAALVAHGLGMKATGRMDGGADYEPMRAHDAKKMKKGGGE